MKEDKRVIRTKNTIKEVFISLVEEKGYSKVSVKDIAKKAKINRNTFYLHYLDKEDLIDKIIFEVLESQNDELDSLTKQYLLIPEKQISIYLTNILKMISKEIEFYRILITDPCLSGYLTKLKDTFKKRYINSLYTSYKKLVLIEYMINGIFGVLSEWIRQDSFSQEDIIETLTTIVIRDYSYILID